MILFTNMCILVAYFQTTYTMHVHLRLLIAIHRCMYYSVVINEIFYMLLKLSFKILYISTPS